jgi:hypothetical protein
MKLYFSLKSMPELANLPEEKQKEVWQKCSGNYWHHWQTWVATLVLCACFILGENIGMRFGGIYWQIICTVIGCYIGGVILNQTITSMVRTNIREYLSSHEKTN